MWMLSTTRRCYKSENRTENGCRYLRHDWQRDFVTRSRCRTCWSRSFCWSEKLKRQEALWWNGETFPSGFSTNPDAHDPCHTLHKYISFPDDLICGAPTTPGFRERVYYNNCIRILLQSGELPTNAWPASQDSQILHHRILGNSISVYRAPFWRGHSARVARRTFCNTADTESFDSGGEHSWHAWVSRTSWQRICRTYCIGATDPDVLSGNETSTHFWNQKVLSKHCKRILFLRQWWILDILASGFWLLACFRAWCRTCRSASCSGGGWSSCDYTKPLLKHTSWYRWNRQRRGSWHGRRWCDGTPEWWTCRSWSISGTSNVRRPLSASARPGSWSSLCSWPCARPSCACRGPRSRRTPCYRRHNWMSCPLSDNLRFVGGPLTKIRPL